MLIPLLINRATIPNNSFYFVENFEVDVSVDNNYGSHSILSFMGHTACEKY